MKGFIWFRIILIAAFCFIGFEIFSQCPMCRMSAESNLQNGGTAGKGLNLGILYMLVMPYLFVSVLGYIWWRNRRMENPELN